MAREHVLLAITKAAARWMSWFAAGCLLGSLSVYSYLKLSSLEATAAAAWVQAIGSIVAIGIAIWVPWRQGKRADKERREKEDRQTLRRMRAMCRLIADFLRFTREIERVTVAGAPFRPPLEECRDFIARLNDVSMEDLPDRTLRDLFMLRRRAFALLDRCSPYSSGMVQLTPSDRQWFKELKQLVDQHNRRAHAFLNAAHVSLNVPVEKRWPLVDAHTPGATNLPTLHDKKWRMGATPDTLVESGLDVH